MHRLTEIAANGDVEVQPRYQAAAQYDSCKRCNCNANRHAFASEQRRKKQRPNRAHAFG